MTLINTSMVYVLRKIKMADLESVLRYSELLNLYQSLLSETQREILDDYFSFNLSFSEIAENRHISRSAVEDAIKKGKKKLDDYENKLGSLKALQLIHEALAASDDKKVSSKLEEAERIMKHGI